MSRLPRTTKNEMLQVFTPDPDLTTTITSPATYTIPKGVSCIMLRPDNDVTVKLNGDGAAMLYDGGTKEILGIYQGEGRSDPAVTRLVFANSATVVIWAM